MWRPLYEIDNDFLSCFDEETGELVDEEKFAALEMERNAKIEGVGLAIKNLNAEIEDFKEEKKVFDAKIKSATRRRDGLFRWLEGVLAGRRFHTPKLDVKFTHSQAVEIDKDVEIPEEYLRIKKEPDKIALKEAILLGEIIDGVTIAEKLNMQVK